MRILVLNAGSSSLKFALYTGGLEEIRRGAIVGIGPDARLEARGGGPPARPVPAGDHGAAARVVLDALAADWSADDVVVHRIVHGGTEFSAPVRLDEAVVATLRGLEVLAPLHLPAARRVIEACRDVLGAAAPAIGVFDTALFRALPPAAREYAIPKEWRTSFGVRRYGFHGFAHQCLRDAALRHATVPRETARIVTAQLGRGCSLAAFRGTSPVATSMGFSPLEGLVMPTRAGSLDAAAALYLVMQHGLKPQEVLRVLNEQSGMLGLSGVSAEPAELVRRAQEGNAACGFALDVFFDRFREYIGAYAGVLGGLDVLALGGGICEHVPEVRRRALETARWLGCEIGPTEPLREGAVAVLSGPGSGVLGLLVFVDEERAMAGQALNVLGGREGAPP